jgi:predicted branched-subunit amino acid permease
MTDPSTRRAFGLGMRDGLPFLVVIVPFGMVFGLLADEAGWALPETLGMSIAVVAGASQFTALQLLSEQAPLLVTIATALAVNLRLAMYSASLAPHFGGGRPFWQRALAAYALTDQTYGLSMNRFALQPQMSPGQKLAHFLGGAVVVCAPWYVATWAGAVAGSAVPAGLALDFAVPITFLALIGPALRGFPHVAAAAVSVVVALLLASLPYSLGLLVAAVAAMLTGALCEAWQEGRA